MSSRRLFWPVIIILVGVLLLGNNLGIFDINLWTVFWPLFLILLGIWFLVGNLTGGEEISEEEATIPLQGASEARVIVKHGAGRLTADGSAEAGSLVSGRFANGLDASVKTVGSRLEAVMRPQSRMWMNPNRWVSGQGLRWDFGFTPDIPLELVFETGAAETTLDLETLQVKDLILKTGASATDITLPAGAGMTDVKVEAGAASVRIRIPDGVAARVEAEAGLAAVEVDSSRFPKEGNTYQSTDYDSAENKVHIRIETGLGSIEIR